jgi:hypothetical protein
MFYHVLFKVIFEVMVPADRNSDKISFGSLNRISVRITDPKFGSGIPDRNLDW